MAYATADAFVASVGLAEAKALAGPAADPGYDAALIDDKLANASAELDTYFAGRYPTPLSPVPRIVEVATIALAREALDRQGRDLVKAEAARHRAWAKDVSKGIASLAGDEAGQQAPEASPNAGGAQFVAPARVFDDAGLASFLGGD